MLASGEWGVRCRTDSRDFGTVVGRAKAVGAFFLSKEPPPRRHRLARARHCQVHGGQGPSSTRTPAFSTAGPSLPWLGEWG